MAKMLMFALNLQNFAEASKPTLKSNAIYAAISNMIISQYVVSDNVDGLEDSLVSKAKVDGTMYGDTKVYYDTDALHSKQWLGDGEASNLLALHRAKNPEVQSIVLDVFRQISLTLDAYLTKQAWMDEGAFVSFNSVELSWITNTQKLYDYFTYNAFFGTEVSPKATQNLEFEIPEGDTEDHLRLRAQKISKGLADLFIDMKDATRKYNDYGHMKAFKKSACKVVWNSKFVTEITKLDLPSIFNKDSVFGDSAFEEVMPARFWGTINVDGGTAPSSNTRIRSLIEKDYNTVEEGQPGYDDAKSLFPGDLLPDGTVYEANETYTEDPNIICKVVVRFPPYMSGFQVGTSFFNAKSLTENHYRTFAHNTLVHLEAYPFVTIKAKSLAKSATKTTSTKAA